MASGRNAHVISKYIGSNPQPASNVQAPVRSCASNIAELSITAAQFVSGTLGVLRMYSILCAPWSARPFKLLSRGAAAVARLKLEELRRAGGLGLGIF